jgi:GTP cyclohydrolase IA
VSIHVGVYTPPDVQHATHELLCALGEDPERDGLKDTPRRVTEAYRELLAGYEVDVVGLLKQFEHTSSESLIVVKDIPFYSLCEHHLLPFFGSAHVGYIPHDNKVLGLSKIPRLVEAYARRLQVQERIADQIADTLAKHVTPHAAVIIEARHMCMEVRGIEKPGMITTTSAMRGKFFDVVPLRQEFLSLIRR